MYRGDRLCGTMCVMVNTLNLYLIDVSVFILDDITLEEHHLLSLFLVQAIHLQTFKTVDK